MSDHLTFQRTPSQFVWLMLDPAALAAWWDDDNQPWEKMYMPCGAGFIGMGVAASAPPSGAGEDSCPCAVDESAKNASAMQRMPRPAVAGVIEFLFIPYLDRDFNRNALITATVCSHQ